ncbi:MAG: hypothetical protein KKA42_07260, partial [candidate division Zixibacteria bacterium]|nr:hypothetical protein [candidate division Zixibacteria bacterium]
MKRLASTCKWALVLLPVLLLPGCGQRPPVTQESETVPPATVVDRRGYDPLEFVSDRQVVPAENPRSGVISGREVLVGRDDTTVVVDSLEAIPEAIKPVVD